MTEPRPQATTPIPADADVTGHMIKEERQPKPAPYDRGDGLFPYQIMGPTISNGYIFYPSGNTLPYR